MTVLFKISAFLLLSLSMTLTFVESISENRKNVLIDTVKDALKVEADQLDSVQQHYDSPVGFGHSRDEAEVKAKILSPLLEASDYKVHHKSKPPVLGSLCDYEEYTKLFTAYYAVPFLNYAERLYEHKNIETELGQGITDESNERAWGLCQFGGLMMQCGENRKCQCLHVKPPYRYIKGKVNETSEEVTCLGDVGSICSTDPRTLLHCKAGVTCSQGYCGGLQLAAKKLTAVISSVSRHAIDNYLLIFILIDFIILK